MSVTRMYYAVIFEICGFALEFLSVFVLVYKLFLT